MRPLEAMEKFNIKENDYVGLNGLNHNRIGKILFLGTSTFTIAVNGVMYEYFYTGKSLLYSYSIGDIEILSKLSKEDYPEYYL